MSTKTATDTLRTLIENTMTHGDFMKLHQQLNMSKKGLTMMLNDPEGMSLYKIKKISAILKISPFRLIREYKCGVASITIDEMNELLKQYNEE